MPELVPAILTNDISDFRKKYADLLGIGHYFSKLHIDFIDGDFLPGKTIMPADLKSLKSPFELMAHFMTFEPKRYFQEAVDSGFKWATVQFEAFDGNDDCMETLKLGKKMGLRMGLAISPETHLYEAAKALAHAQLVQIMGVHPGAQGRTFEVGTLEKVAELKSLTRDIIISVDGGIRLGIAKQCVNSGADMIIIGSAILHATHPKEALEAFKRELELI